MQTDPRGGEGRLQWNIPINLVSMRRTVSNPKLSETSIQREIYEENHSALRKVLSLCLWGSLSQKYKKQFVMSFLLNLMLFLKMRLHTCGYLEVLEICYKLCNFYLGPLSVNNFKYRLTNCCKNCTID